MTSPFLHDAAMFTLSGTHDTEAPIEWLEYFETAGVFGEGEGKGECLTSSRHLDHAEEVALTMVEICSYCNCHYVIV